MCVAVYVAVCDAVCCRVSTAAFRLSTAECCSMLQRSAVRCRVLRCIAVCRHVLQCVAVCCSELQYVMSC